MKYAPDPIQDTEKLSNKEPRFLQADSHISHEKRAPDITLIHEHTLAYTRAGLIL